MGSEMPKKSRTYEPISIEPAISQNMLRAMRRASSARIVGDAPSVRLRKIGAVAAGLRIGNIVTNTNRKLLAATRTSSIVMAAKQGRRQCQDS